MEFSETFVKMSVIHVVTLQQEVAVSASPQLRHSWEAEVFLWRDGRPSGLGQLQVFNQTCEFENGMLRCYEATNCPNQAWIFLQ